MYTHITTSSAPKLIVSIADDPSFGELYLVLAAFLAALRTSSAFSVSLVHIGFALKLMCRVVKVCNTAKKNQPFIPLFINIPIRTSLMTAKVRAIPKALPVSAFHLLM